MQRPNITDNAIRLKGNGITTGQQMASSCTGAMLVSLLMTPLDVVKIRLQAQDRIYAKKCFVYNNGIMDHLCPRLNGDPLPAALHTPEEICNCRWYNRPKYFNGTVDAFVKIARVEGLTSLWSGLSPTLVLAVPTTVAYFTAYEGLKADLGPHMPGQPSAAAALAGGLARIWAVTLVSPLELVRTKMQSQRMAFTEVWAALGLTIKAEGVGGLWRGLSATILRDVPFSALYWPIYELLRPAEYNFRETFLAGACAGSAASAITQPMDVVKTHCQIELGVKGVRRGNAAVFREIVAGQGVRGLYAGLAPRILKVAPACAVMISSYEHCKRFFMSVNSGPLRV